MSAAIARVHGRRVWDSRGRPTLEAEVVLECGASGRAIAPAGASRGSREAIDLRDGGSRFGGMDVQQAIASVSGPIRGALEGRHDLDLALIPAETINDSGLFLDDERFVAVRESLPMPVYPSYDFVDVLSLEGQGTPAAPGERAA